MTNSITGRDGYIQKKAWMYAIAHIQSMTEDEQEWSICATCALSLAPR